MNHSWRLYLSWVAFIGLTLCGCVTTGLKESEGLYRAGRLKEALSKYEEALPKAATAKDKELITQRIAQIRSELTEAILNQARQAGGDSRTLPGLRRAAEVLRANLAYEDDRKRVSGALAEHQDTLAKLTAEYDRAIAGAATAETAKEWTKAVVALRRAAELDPSADLANRLRTVVTRRDQEYPARIEQCLSKKDVEEAGRVLEAYGKEDPKPAANLLNRLSASVEQARKTQLEARFDALRGAKQYFTAYQLVCDQKRDYLERRLPELRKEGSAYYLAKAKERFAGYSPEDESGIGYAFFAAEKAWQLDTNNADVFTLRQSIHDVLAEKIQHNISIAKFASPAGDPEAGSSLANSLIEYLLNNVPYGVRILERDKLDALIREVGAANAQTTLAKVKLFIVGDVTASSVERDSSESQGSARVLAGNRTTPNPEYTKYLKEYGKDKAKWPQELRSMTPMIDEPVYENRPYKLGTVRLHGLMVVSVRAFDSLRGAVTRARVFTNAPVNIQDTFSDPVPQALPEPIKLDPLDLPSNIEVKEMLRRDLAGQVGEYVLQSFKAREAGFLASSKVALARREADLELAQLAACYFYCTVDKRFVPRPEDNACFREARQLGFFERTE